ncbi:MAG: DUF952 domain-containing protein [Thermoflexales bacterium]
MILHLVTTDDWNAAPPDLPFTPKAYAADGFIHCAFGDALMLTIANRFYKSQPGEFLAIAIDETRVTAPVKWEAPASPATVETPAATLPPEAEAEFGAAPVGAPAATLFPHIYGSLNRDAILGARRLLREPDGSFTGYTPIDAPTAAQTAARPTDRANPMNLKTASQLANELVDATDEFSKSLDRYKDSIEARMAELDKKIKKL